MLSKGHLQNLKIVLLVQKQKIEHRHKAISNIIGTINSIKKLMSWYIINI